MQARHIIGLTATALALAGVGATPAAAKYRIPEEPSLVISAKHSVKAERTRRALVSIGWNDRYGLELYAPVGGGVRMG